MKTHKHKNFLASEISKIEDELASSRIKLDQYINDLELSEKEIQNGEFYSHNEIKNIIQQWKK
jgi:hypothetical protein